MTNKLGEFTNVGSGTLIDTSESQGLVLTCAHLFAEGAGEIVVEFPGVRNRTGLDWSTWTEMLIWRRW